MDTLIDKLKKFLAESDEDIEKVLTPEQVERIEKIDKKVQKEIEENLDVVAAYTDIPDDLEESLQFLFKQLIDQPEIKEDIDKAGAKLSKTTQAQIKEALGHIKDGPKAITILETLIGKKVEDTKKTDDGKENLSAETLAKLEEYEELKKAKDKQDTKKAEEKQAEKVLEIVNKALKDAGIDEIPEKKSIDDPEADKKDKKKETKKGADDDEIDKFPSIPIPVLGD